MKYTNTKKYENLSEEILIEILSLCQEYVRQINTGILN